MSNSSVHEKFISGLMDTQSMGRYKIIRKLGQGGSGVVYLARDAYIQRQVALKISRGISSQSRKKLFLEAQSAGRLSHPNILTVHAVEEHEGRAFLVTEYVPGLDLRKLVRRDGPMGMEKAASIIAQVAEGLADVYPRLGPTMEWDTAAGQAIVEQAGGSLVQADSGKPLRYNKPDLLNPWFVVTKKDMQ